MTRPPGSPRSSGGTSTLPRVMFSTTSPNTSLTAPTSLTIASPGALTETPLTCTAPTIPLAIPPGLPPGGAEATGPEKAKAPGASVTGRLVCVITCGVGVFVTTRGTFGLIGASIFTTRCENSNTVCV